MADNVSITQGTGTTVSTEEITTLNGGAVSAQHVQRVANAIRTADNTAIDLPGDATNGLDVDITRVIPGTDATHLGKAEDAAHNSGDTGVMALSVRNDTGAALAGTTGDYIPQTTDARGSLFITGNGHVSTANSSTATLGGGAAFTGTSEDIRHVAQVQINVFSDVASATDGLSIQQSSNGTNWDITDTYTVPAATGKTFSVQPAANFFRVVYTNGGGAQSAFRLQTIYKGVAGKGSSQRPSDGLSNDNDFEQVSAFNSVFNGTTWDRMRGASGGNLYVASPGATRTVSITRPADTTAYAANDALSDSTSAPTTGGFTITNAARVSGGSGYITDMIVVSSNPASTPLQAEVLIFDTAVTAVNDNALLVYSDAEALTLVAVIPFTMTAIASTNNNYAHVQGPPTLFTTSGSANLRFLVRVKNAYTPANAEVLTFRFKIQQID